MRIGVKCESSMEPKYFRRNKTKQSENIFPFLTTIVWIFRLNCSFAQVSFDFCTLFAFTILLFFCDPHFTCACSLSFVVRNCSGYSSQSGSFLDHYLYNNFCFPYICLITSRLRFRFCFKFVHFCCSDQRV